MNIQEQQLLPCPECASQRTFVGNQRLELNGQTLEVNIAICSNCGYTAFFATEPEEMIETAQEKGRTNLERQAKSHIHPQSSEGQSSKKGFFGR